MEAFGRFWTANSLMIGIVCTVLAIGAGVMKMGQVATVLGLIGGTAFMWIGRNPHVEDSEEEEA